MGMTRKDSTTDEEYTYRHANYLKHKEKLLAQAKVRYQQERQTRLEVAKRMRDAARLQRLQEKRAEAYKDKPLPFAQKDTAAFVQEFKESRPCQDCGLFYPYYVMDLDHVRGDKVAMLSDLTGKGRSLKKVIAELEKCDLVCSNCHRTRTHNRK